MLRRISTNNSTAIYNDQNNNSPAIQAGRLRRSNSLPSGHESLAGHSTAAANENPRTRTRASLPDHFADSPTLISTNIDLTLARTKNMPRCLDIYNLESSAVYQSHPSKIAVLGGGLAGVISALKLQSLGHKVSLYEANTDICLEASKIPAHCYGPPGYCHLPQKQQVEIFRSGLAFAKAFPQAISMRPTVFALRQNDRVPITDDPNGRLRDTHDLSSATLLAHEEYKKEVKNNPRNEVFGPVDEYQKSYSQEQVHQLRQRPPIETPRNNDEWVTNWAREMSEEALSQLRYPVFLVQEAEINMMRFREVARNALEELAVDVRMGEVVNNLTSPKNEQGILVNRTHFDYAVNCTGAESGANDEKRGVSAERTLIVKGAGLASLPAPIDTMPQMYIMGKPMVHVSPFEGGAAVINVTSPECTYVENGEAHCDKGRSQPFITESMRDVMKSSGKGRMLYRSENMIRELSELMPRMFGGAPEAFLGGHVCVPSGPSEHRAAGIISSTENALTIISPKATSSMNIDLAEKISVASRFRVHLPIGTDKNMQFRMDENVLSEKSQEKAKDLGLPVGMSRVFGEKTSQADSEFTPPKNAKKIETSDDFDAAYHDAKGNKHIVIDGTDYVRGRRLGVGFGGEAYIYKNQETSHPIVAKEYFRLRSQASPGDMDNNPPSDASKRAELQKIQMEDFLVEKNAFDALAARPAGNNVAHALRTGLVDGRPTIIMPYFDGGSVRDLCKDLDAAIKNKVISAEQRHLAALYIMQGIIKGMNHVAPVFIHRDLKPENILLHTRDRKNGALEITPKIADFGTSALGTQATIPVVTTPQYKSPEYIEAERNGAGTHTQAQDVWSAGISLHELLTGSRPFDGKLPEQEQDIYKKVSSYASGEKTMDILPGDQSKAADLVRLMLRPDSQRAHPSDLLKHGAFDAVDEKECQKILSLVHRNHS